MSITNLKSIESLSGLALTQKLGVGKYKGKYLVDLPDNYLRYCHEKKIFDYDRVRAKIEEAKNIKLPDKSNSALPIYTESDLSPWLYEYQKRELMRFPGRSRIIINGCIGSGKTILALELARLYGYRKSLIPVPKTVYSSWVNKIMDKTKESYIRLTGSIDERTEILQNTNYTFYLINPESYMSFESDITKSKKSRDTMDKKNNSYRKLLEAIIHAKFEFNFFDESHLYLQNHSTSIYKSIKLALQYIPHPYLMTGTFFSEGKENRAIDQLHLINPSLFDDKAITTIYKEWFFIDSYYKPAGIKPEFAPVLAKIIAENSMVIRSSELKLPEPIFKTHEIEMTGEILRAYKNAQKDLIYDIGANDVDKKTFNQLVRQFRLALATRYRQISGGIYKKERLNDNSKITELLNCISEYGNESFVIGCQYVDEIFLVKETLLKKKYKISVIHGKVKDNDRESELNKFIRQENQVLIIQNETGGVGIDNLQRVCRFWIIYSSSYSNTDEDQFIGRLVRTGQPTNAVFTRLLHVLSDGEISIEQIMVEAVKLKINNELEFADLIDKYIKIDMDDLKLKLMVK